MTITMLRCLATNKHMPVWVLEQLRLDKDYRVRDIIKARLS